MGVLVFNDAIHGHASIDATRADDGYLADKGHPLLDDGVVAFKGCPRAGEIGVGVHFALTFPIVAKGGRFDHTGESEFTHGFLQTCEIFDDAEFGTGDALFTQEEFFTLAMLRRMDRLPAWAQGLHGLDCLQTQVGDVFKLSGDDIDL
jgi:hypothetical protein